MGSQVELTDFVVQSQCPTLSATTSNMSKSVFCGNLNFRCTEDDLGNLFSQHGNVVNVRIVNDRETGRSRGFAFVEFDDPSSVQNAIQGLNGYELLGRPLRLDQANQRN